MKKRNQKLTGLFLAAAMAVTMTGCGNPSAAEVMDDTPEQKSEEESTREESQDSQESQPEESQGSAAAEGIDLSERVDLVFYVLGDPPAAEKEVEDAINEILLEKANATVDFQFSTWTDWGTKYNNALLDGSVDLIYTANWNSFGLLAQNGAFMALDDLFDTVAPELKEQMGESMLNMCRVNGKIMTVPCLWKQFSSVGIEYREDLRKKYDLPVPDSLENFEAYLLGIQENEPDQGLLNANASCVVKGMYPWIELAYGLASDYDTPAEVYDWWFSDDFMDAMKLMKKWADLGFWSKSSLSSDATDADYENGQCVALTAGLNPNKVVTRMDLFAKEHPDWETAFIAYGEINGVIFANHATADATAITSTCKNPERAMYVLDLLIRDKELNQLNQYGIESVHYEVDDNGLYKNLSEDFNFEGLNAWSLRNPEYKLPRDVDVVMNEMFSRYEAMGDQTKWKNTDIAGAFTEDTNSYSAEKAAIDNVKAEYLAPLEAGQVEDVEAGVETFRNKLKEAGLDTVREAYLAQWLAYCEENGYDK